MGKSDISDLLQFLESFPPLVKEITLSLREFIWDQYPECNELIYDNYNALAIGFSPSDRAGDVFCSLAVYSKHVNFGFNRGSEIADPENRLKGSGSLYRSLKVSDLEDFPRHYIRKLMQEAYINSLARLNEGKTASQGTTIIKSISAKKRRPGS